MPWSHASRDGSRGIDHHLGAPRVDVDVAIYLWPILLGSQAVFKLFCWDLSWIIMKFSMKFSPLLPRFCQAKGRSFFQKWGIDMDLQPTLKGIELMRKLRWRTRGRKLYRLGDHNPVEMGSLQLVPPNNRLPQTPMVLHNVHSQNDHKWRIIIMDDSTLCKHTVTHPMSIRLSSKSIPVLDG